MSPLEPHLLPEGVRARFVDGVNGLRMHILEAGEPGRPLILLLHGFPEIAYSWRKLLRPLADAGHHVVAPDNRGFGRTLPAPSAYDVDLAPFSMLNLVRDVLSLAAALGASEIALLAGHDFGASLAGACALARPDLVRRLAVMSAPFAGAPPLPGGPPFDPTEALAALDPPRQHYHWYYSTRRAAPDMDDPPGGLHAFLRAYFHQKSADWPGNHPHRLSAWTAEALAVLPSYYVMPKGSTMPQAVAPYAPTPAEVAACAWLTEDELDVYAGEYARSGFQGGLNWYRTRTNGLSARDLATFAGRRIAVPTAFLSGAQDWGTFQKPGDLEAMQLSFERLTVDLVEGAGHWIQQEQPEATLARLFRML